MRRFGSLKRFTNPTFPSTFKNSACLPSARTLTLSIKWSYTPWIKLEYDTFPNGAIFSSTANAGYCPIPDIERATAILISYFLKFW